MDKTLTSILAGLGGMFGWGISDFFANWSSEKIGHFKVFFWSQLAGVLFVLALIPFFSFNSSLTFGAVALLSAASVLYASGYLYFYKAFELGNVSVVSATINLNVIIAMVVAMVFMGQKLTGIQPFAVLLVLAGVTLVSINLNDLKNKQLQLLAGVKEAILASFLFGFFWNLSEVISEQIGWLSTTLYVKVGAVGGLLLFALFTKKTLSLSKFDLKTKLVVALVGVLEAMAVASVNFGLSVGDLVLVSPISSALSVVTIVMAIIFLKEKISKVQTLGILSVIVGIVLTAV